MTTTISPGLGGGALYTQLGRGQSPGYDAIDRRRSYSVGLQEGVTAPSSYAVTQRGAGANMSVDIAASTIDATSGLGALVLGDSVTGQGLYGIPGHTATINEGIAAAHASLPRVDIVVMEILDHVHDASSSNLSRVRVITGTPTSGANLNANRSPSAPALPSNCLLLADVLVGPAASSITNAAIRDRRRWACGANAVLAGSGLGDITAPSSTPVTAIAAARVECSGAPMVLTLSATGFIADSGTLAAVAIRVDGATINNGIVLQEAGNTTRQPRPCSNPLQTSRCGPRAGHDRQEFR